MQTYEKAMSAGERWETPAAKFFMLLDTTYPVDVTFRDMAHKKLGSVLDVEKSFKVSFHVKGPISALIESSQAQTVKIATSEVGEIDYSVSSGEMDVTVLKDLSGYHSFQTDKNSFIGGHYEAAQATKYSQVILSNPNGSGITAIVEAFACAFDVFSGVRIINAAGAFGSLQRYGINKYQGEADSLCQIRSSAVTSPVTGKDSGALISVSTPSQRVELKHGLILPENHSLVLRPGAVNVYNVAMFEWIEI